MTLRSRTNRLFYVIPAIALLAGCAVDQKKEVDIYRAVLDENSPGIAPPLGSGEKLTLQRAFMLANQGNENLGLRGEDYLQALIARQRALSAFLPTISIAPSYTFRDNHNGNGSLTTSGGIVNTGSSGSIIHQLDVPVTGNVNLFNGFRDVATLNAAKFTAEQRRGLLLDLQSSLMLQVAQSYYQVLSLQQSIVVLTESLKVQAARVHDAKTRLDAGVAPPLDVYQSQADEAATRVTLVDTQSNERNARTALGFIIGYRVDGELVDEFSLPSIVPDRSDYLRIAQQNREDLRAAVAAREAAKYNVQQAIGQYYPSVTLNLEAFLYREHFSDLARWDGILQGSLPIFSAGIIEANVRTAWSQLRQAALTESLTSRTVEQDVYTAYENFVASGQRLKELETEVAAAAEAFRVADRSYAAGKATNLERLTAQDTLLNAQLQQTTERFNQKVFFLDLLRLSGVLKVKLPFIPTTVPSTRPATFPTYPPSTQPGPAPIRRPATVPAPATAPATTPATAPALTPQVIPTSSPVSRPASNPTTLPATNAVRATTRPA